MEIRLQGFEHEVDRVVDRLKESPDFMITRISRTYANRNSPIVRQYIEIDLTQAKEVSQNG